VAKPSWGSDSANAGRPLRFWVTGLMERVADRTVEATIRALRLVNKRRHFESTERG
jgi:hypothetical protein